MKKKETYIIAEMSDLIEKDVIDFVDGEVFNLYISLLPWNRGSKPNYWSFI